MTAATASARPSSSAARTTVLLGAGAAAALIANSIVALTASAAGATPGWTPFQLPVYGAFTVLGLIAGWIGWRTVARRAEHPSPVLRVLVPVVAVLSFVPDVALGILRFIPGTTTVGALGLSVMHLVVLGVAIPLYAKLAPVRQPLAGSRT